MLTDRAVIEEPGAYPMIGSPVYVYNNTHAEQVRSYLLRDNGEAIAES